MIKLVLNRNGTLQERSHCGVCRALDGKCSLESYGLERNDIEYLYRKVIERDMVAISHFIKGINFARYNAELITLPKWRDDALKRLRVKRASRLLRDLANHIDEWVD